MTRARWPRGVNVSWDEIGHERAIVGGPESVLSAGSVTARRLPPGGAAAVSVGASLGLVAIFVLIAVVAGMSSASTSAVGGGDVGGSGEGASAFALRDIPSAYLRLYQAAGARYGLDWAILAGIGKVECDHGRDPDPSCTHEGATNSAGAGGPMQFLASTWATYGVDGDGDGRRDRWDPADAIYGAANYLHASGAPGDYRSAIFAYNHAGWYVAEVAAVGGEVPRPARLGLALGARRRRGR